MEIADYWSREAQPAATRAETLAEIIRAWWCGELVGIGGPRRFNVLRLLFEKHRDSIAFSAPGIEADRLYENTADGGLLIIRHLLIPLPNLNPETWDDRSCLPAYRAVADGWDRLKREYALEPAIGLTKLSRDEFFSWLAGRGSWRPRFWGAGNSNKAGPQALMVEPALLALSEAAQRIVTRWKVSVDEARARLERAFRDRELVPVGAAGKTVEAWDRAIIDWNGGGVTWSMPLGDGGHVDSKLVDVRVSTSHLDEWMAQALSSMMKQQMAARLFAEPFWPVQRVLRWIAFRDAAHIESSLRAAKMYSSDVSTPLRERSPELALLRALQYDNLRAIKNGRELPREEWASADGHKWPDVRFRREDVLVLWPDPLSDGAAHLNFKEIAYRWSKLAGEPSERILDALIKGFWCGAFENDGESRIFNLVLPNGPPSSAADQTAGQYAYSSTHEGDAVTKIGEDGERHLTLERRAVRIYRREVAEVLGGSSYIPWVWDGTEDGLLTYTGVPYSSWPPKMRKQHFEEWRITWADFKTWYDATSIHPKPALESMWPSLSAGRRGETKHERLLPQARGPAPISVVVPSGANAATPEFRHANRAAIHAALTAVYDEAERKKKKPPNIKEVAGLVQPILAKKGYKASGRQIQQLAEAPQHAHRRRKPGKTVASELSHPQK